MFKHTRIAQFITAFFIITHIDPNYSIELNRAQLFAWIPDYANATVFHLNAKQIDSIEDETFLDLPNVKSLYLNSNPLTYHLNNTPLLFDGLVNLEYLKLTSCQLECVDELTFVNLNNLKRLYLNKNRFSSFSSMTFHNLRLLIELNLEENSLSEILDSSLFEHLISLTTLKLSQNQFSSISSSAFACLNTTLTYLDLSLNNLSQLDEMTFKALTYLRWLSLEQNQIFN